MERENKYIDLLRRFAIDHGKEYGISKIGVFGSLARDSATDKSDIDIIYEGQPIGLLDNRDLKSHLESYLQRPIDLVRNHKYISPILLKQINREIIYV